MFSKKCYPVIDLRQRYVGQLEWSFPSSVSELRFDELVKPPIQNEEFEPASHVNRFLESFHESSASLDQIVEPLENVVVWTHFGIVVVSEEQIKVSLQDTNYLFQFFTLGAIVRILQEFRQGGSRFVLGGRKQYFFHPTFDLAVELRLGWTKQASGYYTTDLDLNELSFFRTIIQAVFLWYTIRSNLL